jgi:hypothetical protein
MFLSRFGYWRESARALGAGLLRGGKSAAPSQIDFVSL